MRQEPNFNMKKSLTIVIIFILAVKAVDITVYQFLKFFCSHTFIGQDGGDFNKYLSDKNPPALVIMGSSTTRFQVCPDSFPVKTGNLARSMTADAYQLGLLSIMIHHHQVPKNILLSLWPRNYVSAKPNGSASEDILYLKYYYDQSDFVRKEINKISYTEKLKFFLFQSYRFNGDAINILKNYLLSRNHHKDKYFFKYEMANTDDSLNILRIKQLHQQVPVELTTGYLNRNQTRYLPEFIKLCRKNDINLICYFMPLLEEDYNFIGPGIQFTDSLMASNKLPYLKFSEENSPELFHHKSWWIDGEHMNELGAALQSNILAGFFKQHQQKK